jgi:predicted transglutaminase-like cysteine proteinase
LFKYKENFWSFPAAFILTIMVLLFVNGCGARKKTSEVAVGLEPDRQVELEPGQQRIADWHALIREKRHVSEMEKLESVNSFFNQLEFVDDLAHWGRKDYWSTPQEMLASNGGDCEDFATAKYFTLLQLDVPDDNMRLTYVKALQLKQPHMVLSYYPEPNADPLILDSLIKRILSASERPDLIPVYSFNGKGLWLAKKQNSERLGGAERLSLWQDLQTRFSREAVASPLPE